MARELIHAYSAATLVLSDVDVDVDDDDEVGRRVRRPGTPRRALLPPRAAAHGGESRAIGALARHHGWRSLAGVASTSHLIRAWLLVEQCTHVQVRMIDAGRSGRLLDGRIVRGWVRDHLFAPSSDAVVNLQAEAYRDDQIRPRRQRHGGHAAR